jgi:hypothetical protein
VRWWRRTAVRSILWIGLLALASACKDVGDAAPATPPSKPTKADTPRRTGPAKATKPSSQTKRPATSATSAPASAPAKPTGPRLGWMSSFGGSVALALGVSQPARRPTSRAATKSPATTSRPATASAVPASGPATASRPATTSRPATIRHAATARPKPGALRLTDCLRLDDTSSGDSVKVLPKAVAREATRADQDKGSRYTLHGKSRLRLPFDKRPWYLTCGVMGDGFGSCDLFRFEQKAYSSVASSKYGREPGGLLVERAPDGTPLRLTWLREQDDDCCQGGEKETWTEVVGIARLEKKGAVGLGTVQLGFTRQEGKAKSTHLRLCFEDPKGLTGKSLLRALVAVRHGVAVRAVAWDAKRKTFACADLRRNRVDLAVRRALAGERLSDETLGNLAKL